MRAVSPRLWAICEMVPTNYRRERRQRNDCVSDPILAHTFENGLVLLGEPIAGVESAAFTLRVPAGTAYEAG